MLSRDTKKRMLFVCVTMLFVGVLSFLLGELFIRFMCPQKYMYPRWQYSAEYGFLLYPNTTMVQACPGEWRFTYTINELGYRGRAVPLADSYDTTNIVVLGDSYSFGHGVNDGEEYPAVLKEMLGNEYEVINLGVGGWGLTQQIKRFYAFGQKYNPSVVVVQFCSNDLDDGMLHRVTEIEDGVFVFSPSPHTIGCMKQYLSRSPIQCSQLYNFFTNTFYRSVRKFMLKKRTTNHDSSGNNMHRSAAKEEQVSEREQFYADLLRLFAAKLNDAGIMFFFMDISGELERTTIVKSAVTALQVEGLLRYCDTQVWLRDVADYGSPEGHAWGAKAHAIVGKELAMIINESDGVAA